MGAVRDAGTIKLGSLATIEASKAEISGIADRLEGRIEIEPGAMVVSEHDDKLTPLLPHSLRNFVKAETGRHNRVGYLALKITIEHPNVFV